MTKKRFLQLVLALTLLVVTRPPIPTEPEVAREPFDYVSYNYNIIRYKNKISYFSSGELYIRYIYIVELRDKIYNQTHVKCVGDDFVDAELNARKIEERKRQKIKKTINNFLYGRSEFEI